MEPITVTCGKDCQKRGHILRQIHPWILGVGVVNIDYCSQLSIDNIRVRVKDALDIHISDQNGGSVGALCEEIKKDLRRCQ